MHIHGRLDNVLCEPVDYRTKGPIGKGDVWCGKLCPCECVDKERWWLGVVPDDIYLDIVIITYYEKRRFNYFDDYLRHLRECLEAAGL